MLDTNSYDLVSVGRRAVRVGSVPQSGCIAKTRPCDQSALLNVVGYTSSLRAGPKRKIQTSLLQQALLR
jgi:hypothetical protein